MRAIQYGHEIKKVFYNILNTLQAFEQMQLWNEMLNLLKDIMADEISMIKLRIVDRFTFLLCFAARHTKR